jgi:hypothetical protein
MPTVSPASGETPSKIFTISICCKTRTNPQTLSDFISFLSFLYFFIRLFPYILNCLLLHQTFSSYV